MTLLRVPTPLIRNMHSFNSTINGAELLNTKLKNKRFMDLGSFIGVKEVEKKKASVLTIEKL